MFTVKRSLLFRKHVILSTSESKNTTQIMRGKYNGSIIRSYYVLNNLTYYPDAHNHTND